MFHHFVKCENTVTLTVSAWLEWTTNRSPYYCGIQGGVYSWDLFFQAKDGLRDVAATGVQTCVLPTATSPLAYNVGEWHHVAGVLRNGLAEIYVDGALVAQDTTSPITSVRISTQTMIGQVASDFAGDIDEVRVFARALTAVEIAALVSGSTLAVEYSLAKLPVAASVLVVHMH